MKDLKFGDVVEIFSNHRWEERIFLHFGKENSVICVSKPTEKSFKNAEDYNTIIWRHGTWRIKKQPEYKPFTFEDREMFRGKWVKHKKFAFECQIACVHASGVGFQKEEYTSFKDFFDNYEFIDGVPCGKEIK